MEAAAQPIRRELAPAYDGKTIIDGAGNVVATSRTETYQREIVSRYNAFPAMLAALEDLLDNGIEWRGGISYALRDATRHSDGGASRRIAAARAALALARGEVK